MVITINKNELYANGELIFKGNLTKIKSQLANCRKIVKGGFTFYYVK